MEKQTFQQGMAYLAAAYAVELSVERAGVYWDQLQNYPDAAFLRAVKSVVGTDERFPMAAKLREAVSAEVRKDEYKTRKIEPPREIDRAKVPSFVQALREKMRPRY
jgi:hypothetical protein